MMSVSSSAMTSILLRATPSEKQYFAKNAEFVSTVWCPLAITTAAVLNTLPPRTSSPIIRQAAVDIFPLKTADIVIGDRDVRSLGGRRFKCDRTRDSRANIRSFVFMLYR